MTTTQDNVTRVNVVTDTVRPLSTLAGLVQHFDKGEVHLNVKVGSAITAADQAAVVEDLRATKAVMPKGLKLRFTVPAGSETGRVLQEALLTVGYDWLN